jgi:hypothetical protein
VPDETEKHRCECVKKNQGMRGHNSIDYR